MGDLFIYMEDPEQGNPYVPSCQQPKPSSYVHVTKHYHLISYVDDSIVHFSFLIHILLTATATFLSIVWGLQLNTTLHIDYLYQYTLEINQNLISSSLLIPI
jgi:adenine C2-methylase RlmN of 23S rRNA A2503 and tRNA A37